MYENFTLSAPCFIGRHYLKQLIKLKLMLLMSLIFTFSAGASHVLAQKADLQVANKSLREVFKLLKAQTNVDFLYTESQLKNAQLVSLNVKQKELREILEICFKEQPLTYILKDNTVLIKQNNSKFNTGEIIGFLDNVSLQQRMITGIVTDENGAGLAGVSVKVKNTSQAAITDKDGNYSITIDNDNVALIFSFVGFITHEIAVSKSNVMDVVLMAAVSDLDEVVVIGYGTQKKVNLTGAVSKITSERLENRTVTNIDQALQGVAPGLNVMTNADLGGEPNSSMGINIRGVGSLSGGSPYVLVDGSPMGLNSVNPADVESISVLKDAASTAIYGSRAAYGVILVTTKTGRANEQMKTSYTNSFSLSEPTYLPGFVNSLRFANSMNEAATNSGQNKIFSDETIDWIVRYQADPENTPSMVEDPKDPNGWGYWNLGHANTDWYDVLYKDWAFSHKHNVGISGGSKSTGYYLGMGWLEDAGKLNYADEKYQKFNLISNISLKLSDKATVFIRSKFNRSYQNFFKSQDVSNRNVFFQMMAMSWPTDPVYTPNGDFTLDKNQPAVLANGGADKQYIMDLWFNPSIELRLTKDWKINGDISYNYNGYKRSDHRAVLWGTATDGVTPIRHYSQNWNRMSQELTYNEYFTSNVFSEFSKQINNHFFSVLLGGQAELSNNMMLNGWRRDLVSESVPAISTAIGDKDIDDNISHWSTLGTFIRLTYNFDEKYLFELNGRYDGSSRFQRGKRWGFFPSASIGYNIWKEKFWEPIEAVINTLKFRASYGALGNQNVANYLHEETIPVQTNLPWIMDGKRPVYTTVPSNRSIGLTWETSETVNLGLDAEILDRRLAFTFDWYNRNTENMFGPGESFPAVYGATVPLKNNATLETKGVELSVNWKQVISEELNYNLGLVYSDSKTTITKYNNPTKYIGNFYEGQRYGEVWGYVTEGLFQSDQEVPAWADQSLFYSRWGAGDIQYKDIDNDGKITNGNQTLGNSGDLQIIGNTSPRYMFGINSTVNYKSFDFNMFWQGVGKRDLWMANSNFFGFREAWTSTIIQAHSLDYWSPENTGSYFARPYLTSENLKNQQVQSRYLQNAAYIRLKNLQIGYSLPREISSKIKIDKVRFYVSGENILTFSGMIESFDPETNVRSSGANLIYPLSRTFAAGVNITF